MKRLTEEFKRNLEKVKKTFEEKIAGIEEDLKFKKDLRENQTGTNIINIGKCGFRTKLDRFIIQQINLTTFKRLQIFGKLKKMFTILSLVKSLLEMIQIFTKNIFTKFTTLTPSVANVINIS